MKNVFFSQKKTVTTVNIEEAYEEEETESHAEDLDDITEEEKTFPPEEEKIDAELLRKS